MPTPSIAAVLVLLVYRRCPPPRPRPCQRVKRIIRGGVDTRRRAGPPASVTEVPDPDAQANRRHPWEEGERPAAVEPFSDRAFVAGSRGPAGRLPAGCRRLASGVSPARQPARGDRRGGVRVAGRALDRRQPPRGTAGTGTGAQRREHRRDPGHRRRTARRKLTMGPGRGSDAVHSRHLGHVRDRRGRRRPGRPAERLRRHRLRRRLPVRRRSRPRACLGGLRSAILAYNHSTAYLATVLAWQRKFTPRRRDRRTRPSTSPIAPIAPPRRP